MELRFDNRNGIQWCRTATHIYLKPHRDLLPWVAHYTLHLGGGGWRRPQRIWRTPPGTWGAFFRHSWA